MIFNNDKNKLIYIASQAISAVIHPLLMPTILFAILSINIPQLFLPYQGNIMYFFLLFIWVSTWVMPSLVIMGLYYMRLVESWQLDSRSDRTLAVGITAVLYAAVAWFLYIKLRANDFIMALMVGIIVSQILSGLVTVFWKISLHMVAMGGFLTYLALVAYRFEADELFYPFLASVAMGGLLASARLYLGKHTIHQIYAGGLLGVAVGAVMYFWF